jgi:hypothetical protein
MDRTNDEMVHAMVHEKAFGKTIAAVYVGDSEYLAFEFTDGTALVLEVASGSFEIAGSDEAAKVLQRAQAAAEKRASARGRIEAKLPAHESEGQALTEASQTG